MTPPEINVSGYSMYTDFIPYELLYTERDLIWAAAGCTGAAKREQIRLWMAHSHAGTDGLDHGHEMRSI